MQYLEAGAPLGLRQRRNLLGVFLRCPFMAGAWVGRWRLEAVRPRRPWSACLVHRRRQARVLRDLPAHPGGYVLFLPGGTLGETAARVALLMGAFWYELDRFCPQADDRVCRHGPDFVLGSRFVWGPASDKLREVLAVAVLAVLVAAISGAVCPVGFGGLSACSFCVPRRRCSLRWLAATVFVAVGVFDAITWNGGLFHSYIVNIRVNLALGDLRAGESSGMAIPLLASDRQYGADSPVRLGFARPPTLWVPS